MIDFEEIIVLRDEKNKQKARYAKHRKDAQKKARHRVSEDHSNCRNRLSISHQRTLTMTETKLNEFFCA